MSVTSSEMEGLSWKNAGLFGPLANELLIFMLSYLNVQDLTRVAQLCKWLKTIADDDILWKKHVAEVFPEETKPEHQSAKEFFRLLTADRFKKRFKKRNPWIGLTAPSLTFDQPASFFDSAQTKLKRALFQGDENEIKKRLSNYKDDLVNSTLPDQLKESNEKLLTFINLSLNNKNNKHAFKMLMDALTPETRKKLLYYNFREKGYLALNYILQGITPFDDEAEHPLILHLLKDEDSCDHYEVLIELVLAYHPKSFFALDENGNTIFHLVCAHGSLYLINYVIDAIMATLPKLFITGDKNNELGIFALVRELENNTRKGGKYNYLRQIAKIIAKYPSLLKKHPVSYVRYNLSLAKLIVLFMGEPLSLRMRAQEEPKAKNDYLEFNALFQEIDKHLIAEEHTTLLHVSLEYNHGISGYWAEKFASSVVDGIRYVDITDKQDRTSLVVALSRNEIHVPVIRELLNAGANPNVMVKGESALCFAFRNNLDKKLIALLLKAGADPDFEYPEGSGKTPLWKYAQKDPELSVLVKESYAKLNKPLPLNGKEKSALIADLVEVNRKLMRQLRELQSNQKTDSNSPESVAPSEGQMNVYNPRKP